MKAVQWNSQKRQIEINDVPLPQLSENQLLIKIASASLCHSDLMSIGDSFVSVERPKPVTLGHEGAGFIAKLHPSAEGHGFKEGDAVGFLYIIGCCFSCPGCMIHNNHCQRGQSHTQGFTFDGFFAEYAVTDYRSAIVLPSTLDVHLSSPYFCAGVTSFHCVKSCELKPQQWLVIIGCGGLGQFAIQFAKAMQYQVIGIDINDDVLFEAKRLGADHTFNTVSNRNASDEVRRLTGGGGADAVAVFSAADSAYRSAPSFLKLGGILMVVGLPAKGVTFDALAIAIGTFKIRGDSTGIPQRMPEAIDFIAEHNIKPELEVHHSLNDVPGMIEKMKAGKATKKTIVSLR